MKRLFVGLLFPAILVLGLACSAEASVDAPRQQTIAIHHSRFLPGLVEARAGVPVSLALRNDDPIEHEWIVGTEELHRRHRLGTEPVHDLLPTEVTIPALSTRLTTVVFDRPGDYAFICHLPGHEAYGMKGVLRVLPN